MASNAGRTKGSSGLSRWTRNVNPSFSRSRNAEPVLALGAGRLVFEFTEFKAGHQLASDCLQELDTRAVSGGLDTLHTARDSLSTGLCCIGLISLQPRPE